MYTTRFFEPKTTPIVSAHFGRWRAVGTCRPCPFRPTACRSISAFGQPPSCTPTPSPRIQCTTHSPNTEDSPSDARCSSSTQCLLMLRLHRRFVGQLELFQLFHDATPAFVLHRVTPT